MDDRCRLYLLTPPRIDDPRAFARDLARALDGGDVACLQIRLKDDAGPADDDHVLRVAEAALAIARPRDVAVLVNDRPDLARKAGADGVHVGRTDMSVAGARALLGRDATIGASCHDSTHLAIEAAEAGADYVAFGAFFPTATKTAPTRARFETLRSWAFATVVPCVAIGGVTAENCAPLVTAGADFLAVSGAVWNAADGPDVAVARLNAAIDAARGSSV